VRRRANGEGEARKVWWMYFVYAHENRTMKVTEIVLRREGQEDEGE
jgi:hypothetical protein